MKPEEKLPAPRTVDELTQRNIDTIVELENATRADRTQTDIFAEGVTRFCGSIRFIWAHILAIGAWSLWNTLPALKAWRYDEFPFFFLCFLLAVEAILLASFILMNQRHESQLSERRNHLDLQINLLSEQENTKMLQMLSQIAHKVGADIHGDPEIAILTAAAQPEKMLQQIDETIRQTEAKKDEPDTSEPLKNEPRA